MSEGEVILDEAKACEHAFQPIVSTATLQTYGVEALARLPGAEDGKALLKLLDRAEKAGAMLAVEGILIESALAKFARSGLSGGISLFCNLDNRIFDGEVPRFDALEDVIVKVGLSFDQIVWEISERDPIELNEAVTDFVQKVARSDVRIALDDFGIGISNLERLLVIEPQYVKIDRCFIDGLALNHRKQAIVAKLCGMAHALGYSTVAEGVETEDDFRASREAGCDYAQGFLIARPALDSAQIRSNYSDAIRRAARNPGIDPQVAKFVDVIQPLHCDALLADAAERFNAQQQLAMLPVVDHLGKFKGAVTERDVRQVLLSEYGRDLLSNRGAPPRALAYAKRCPLADVRTSVDAIIESYVAADAACGLVLLDAGVYAGYLSNNAVLKLAAERDILIARDQNPLTRLPGNQAIDRYIAGSMARCEPVSFAIIDFDNFKAFNDRFGFAAGDRALQMFADALRGFQRRHEVFVGHIGGDDFFVGMPGDPESVREAIAGLCEKFAGDAASLYPLADRSAQGISGFDRFGIARFFPLLRASGGILTLPVGHGQISRSTVERRLVELKARAKRVPDSVVIGCIDGMNMDQISPVGVHQAGRLIPTIAA